MNSVFFKTGIELTTDQINELVHMLTKGCRHKTKARIRSLVTYDLDTLIQNIYWLERFYIHVDSKDILYCAGQSYPCEIRAIRNEMLKKYP